MDPKTRTRTDPKMSDLKPNKKFTSTFWVQNYFTQMNRNRKEPTQTDMYPIRTYLCPT